MKFLTDKEIKAKAKTLGQHHIGGIEGGSVLLRVRQGADGGLLRSWILRKRVNGKVFAQSLGRYNDGTKGGANGLRSSEARALARDRLREFDQTGSFSPREEKAKPKKAKTINDVFPLWLDYMISRNTWRGRGEPQKRRQWFDRFIAPAIGEMKPGEVMPSDVARVLNPLTSEHGGKGGIKDKVRNALAQLFRWCAMEENGYRAQTLINPASSDALANYLRKPTREELAKQRRHHPMCRVEDLPRFVKRLAARLNDTGAMALLFCLLTCSRASNVCRNAANEWAVWEDIDVKKRLWTIPAEKMKQPQNGAHVVPLSSAAMAVLNRVRVLGLSQGEAVFSNSKGTPMTIAAFKSIIRKIHAEDMAEGDGGFFDPDQKGEIMTTHGTARATFRTWAKRHGDKYPPEVAEECLHHARQFGGAYNRDDGASIQRRRELLEEWARYCLSECPDSWQEVK